MSLDKLGTSLTDAIKKLFKAGVVDEAAVKELVRDIQRALLQADVNVQLVLEISKRIEERALKEKVPPGISRKEHVVKVVYEELTRFVGDKPVPIKLKLAKRKSSCSLEFKAQAKPPTQQNLPVTTKNAA